MAIYGVALVALCYFSGMFVGELFGRLLGVSANIGGVGFAMILLVVLTNALEKKGKWTAQAQSGVDFWKNMYIPATVAMAASQNVFQAINGGTLAIFGGLFGVALGFLLLPLLNRIGDPGSEKRKEAPPHD